jgi:hypothetical protein
MIDVTVRVRGVDRLERALIRVERNVDRTTEEFLQFCAHWLRNDIRSNWSRQSPSSEGNPPAVKTGNLDSSVTVSKQGRGDGGRFAASGDAKRWYVVVDTSKGYRPDGRGNYEGILEEFLNRPFMKPAVARLEGKYELFAKRFIRV